MINARRWFQTFCRMFSFHVFVFVCICFCIFIFEKWKRQNKRKEKKKRSKLLNGSNEKWILPNATFRFLRFALLSKFNIVVCLPSLFATDESLTSPERGKLLNCGIGCRRSDDVGVYEEKEKKKNEIFNKIYWNLIQQTAVGIRRTGNVLFGNRLTRNSKFSRSSAACCNFNSLIADISSNFCVSNDERDSISYYKIQNQFQASKMKKKKAKKQINSNRNIYPLQEVFSIWN